MINMKKLIYAISLATSIVGLSKGSYNYVYLQSKSQNGPSCGYYALANAHAVQQLFNENKAINADSIGRLTEQTLTTFFAPFYQGLFDQLSNEEKKQYGSMLAYAEANTDLLNSEETFSLETSKHHFFDMLSNDYNKLDNTYAIQYVPKEREKDHVFIAASNNTDMYGTALQNITAINKKIVHFLYNLGSDNSGHWVYIGVVKQPNQHPYILHLNSTNNNSYETSQEFRTVVQHIMNCIEHKQPLINKNHVRTTSKTEVNEDAQLAQAIQASLQDEALAAKRRLDLQEENDRMYAKQLQEQEDFVFAQKLEQENNDVTYARQLQEQEDHDYALALALSEEYN
jgi:hypothetical protein